MTTTRHTAVVTGAGSGLGRALCLDLAKHGHVVIAADVNLEAARETIEQIGQPNKCLAHQLDVTSIDSVRALSEALTDLPIDVLINNAGLQHVSPIESFPPERWKYLIDVMLVGAFSMIHTMLPRMRQRGFGRIINIGSIHSHVASPYKSAYVAAKHGLVGLSKVVALETSDSDITINTICPSYIRTPLVDGQISKLQAIHQLSEEEVVAKILLEPMPKKSFVTFEEVAEAVRFLIGDHARNITGQSLTIDGGWTIR